MAADLLPIPGFHGYCASVDGSVWSLFGPGHGRIPRRVPKLLKARSDRGYESVQLRIDGAQRKLFVHRAVLLAFRGEPPEGHEVSHINGRSLDNRLENLCWSSKAENEAMKVRHGTHLSGSRSMRRKLCAADVAEIRSRLAVGATFADLGREYGVRWQSIQAIAKGKSWKIA